MEWENYGNGSVTSARLYETAATGPVYKADLWGDQYEWYDNSY
jgi:pectinesterase